MNDVARGRMTEKYLSAAFYAPQYREGMVNIWGNMLKSLNPVTRELIIPKEGAGGPGGEGKPKYKYSFFAEDSSIRDPRLNKLRKLVLGAVLLYTAYNILNKELTGHWMWQNAAGKEFDLQLPPDKNGNISFITWEPSFATVPRAILGAGVYAAQGDTKSATEKFSQVFSSVVTTAIDILTNVNYYGNTIYKTTDTPAQKAAKLTSYASGEVAPSYIKSLVNLAISHANATPTAPAMPLLQALITATALPVTFSTVAKQQTNDVFNAVTAQSLLTAQTTAEAKAEFNTLQNVAATQGQAAAANQFNDLLQSNPALAAKVSTLAEEQKLGFTPTDQVIKSLGVKNGLRAQYIYSEINKLPADQRGAYYNDLITKKLVTQEVSDQITQMIQNGGQSPVAQGGTGNATFEGHPTYGKGSVPTLQNLLEVNPTTTIKSTNPNGEPIYNRLPVSETDKIRQQLYNSDPYWKANGYTLSELQLDDILPVETGSGASINNFQLLTKSADDANNAMENYLGSQYKAGKISRADAAKASYDYKIAKTVSLTDIENGKY